MQRAHLQISKNLVLPIEPLHNLSALPFHVKQAPSESTMFPTAPRYTALVVAFFRPAFPQVRQLTMAMKTATMP